MSHISYIKCDHDDCWDTRTRDPEEARWRTIDDEDWCPRHDPCSACGHQRHQHHDDWDPPAFGCQVGYVLDNTRKSPGRMMPNGQPLVPGEEIWFGETFVVTPGCGCPTFVEATP